MNRKKAYVILEKLDKKICETQIDKLIPEVTEYVKRDKAFMNEAKSSLKTSPKKQELVLLINSLRNLSQSFGSYCDDTQSIDKLVSELYGQLEKMIVSHSQPAANKPNPQIQSQSNGMKM